MRVPPDAGPAQLVADREVRTLLLHRVQLDLHPSIGKTLDVREHLRPTHAFGERVERQVGEVRHGLREALSSETRVTFEAFRSTEPLRTKALR
jgi:hypothetical protein